MFIFHFYFIKNIKVQIFESMEKAGNLGFGKKCGTFLRIIECFN